MAKSTISKVKAKRSGGGSAPAAVTREDLEKLGKPVLRVAIKSRAMDAVGSVADQKGNVVTWATRGGISYSLRDGVLIQTRGIGADLMSAQAPALAQLQGAGNTYQRVYFFLGQDDAATRRTYDCAITSVEKGVIEIFGRSHSTSHVTEDCAWKFGQIKNEYWIEGGVIRKSRQWMSGPVGYVEFERVVD